MNTPETSLDPRVNMHPNKFLITGLTAVALLGAVATERAEAHPHHQSLAEVANEIERDVENGNAVTFDPNSDVYSSEPNYTGEGFQHVTTAPLTATVNGKERLFSIKFQKPKPGGRPNVDIVPLPKKVIKSPSELIQAKPTPGNPFRTSPFSTRRAVIEISTEHPVAQAVVYKKNGERRTITVGAKSDYGFVD